jgi:hypothetical protein
MQGEREENLQEIQEEKKDVFSQIMFGDRKPARNNLRLTTSPEQEKTDSDYSIILEQLFDIYSSIQELKPIVDELSPVVQFIKKKFKS